MLNYVKFFKKKKTKNKKQIAMKNNEFCKSLFVTDIRSLTLGYGSLHYLLNPSCCFLRNKNSFKSSKASMKLGQYE